MKTASTILLATLVVASAAFGADTPNASSAPVAAQTASPSLAPPGDTDAALQRARDLAGAGESGVALKADGEFAQRQEANFASFLQPYLDASPDDLSALPSLELAQARTSAALALSTVKERRRNLDAAIDRVSSARQELETSRERWGRELEAARNQGSAPAFLDRINTLLAGIDGSRDALLARSQMLLELDNRLAALDDRLTRVSSLLDEARGSTRRLFSLTAPPIWRALNPFVETCVKERSPYGPEWARTAQTVRQFWENFSGRIVLHVLVFCLLLGTMMTLKRSRTLRDLESLSGSVRVFTRPVSSAVVIALVLSPLFYPGLPVALTAMVRIASLPPVLRLIPTFVPPMWQTPCYAVAALFGLETVAILLPSGTVLSRLVILAMSGAALWILTIGLNKRLTAAAEWRWARLVRYGRLVVVVFVVCAVLANVFGAMDLALLLNFDVVAPAYLAIGLAAAGFALEDFVRLTLHGKSLQRVRSVALHRSLLLQRASGTMHWLLGALWLWMTLRVLGLDDDVSARTSDLLAWSATIGTFQLSLGNAVLFAATVWVAVLTARFLSFVLENDVLPHMRLARGVPGTITTTVRYLIVGVGLLIAASIAGVDISKVTLILGALSVGIGFGLQNIVNNFISGIILLFERPIQVGDTIQVGELWGVVRGIGVRASRVRTYDGAEVIVPNAELISGRVVNWTLSDRYRRLRLDVGVAYGNRPADIIALLQELVRNHEAALKTPEPFVRFHEFGDSSLNFGIYVWVDFDEGLAATSAILSAVYDRLAEAGVEIPFPQRDLHVRSVSDPVTRTLRGEEA